MLQADKYKCSMCDKAFGFFHYLVTHSLENHNGQVTRLRTQANPDKENVASAIAKLRILRCKNCNACFQKENRVEFSVHVKQCLRKKMADLKTDMMSLKIRKPVQQSKIRPENDQKQDPEQKDYTKETIDMDTTDSNVNDSANGKLFACDKCDYLFRDKSRMFIHYNSVHQGIKPFKCKICPYRSGTNYELNNHMRIIHKTVLKSSLKTKASGIGSGYLTVQCDKCDQKFIYIHEYKMHQRKHFLREKNTCIQCDKTFASNRNLLRHVTSTHTN